jgi:hypothetical protein
MLYNGHAGGRKSDVGDHRCARPSRHDRRERDMLERPGRYRGLRILTLALLSLVLAGLFGVVLRQSWTTNAGSARIVADDRSRVAYLGPLAHLIGALSEAQSAAVREIPVDRAAVQSAVDAVDAVDKTYGTALATTTRWTDLRDRANGVVAQSTAGRAAYQSYSDVLTLALDLAVRVGDTSDQIIEPQLDSFYVIDTALLRLPRVLVSAGRAADLATLATAGTGPVAPADAVQVSVAQHDVAQAAADASASLSKGIEVTNRSVVGAGLAGQLDGFRAAVDVFAPPAVLDTPSAPADLSSLPPAAGLVRVTALALIDAVLTQLDSLLADRQASLANQRQLAIGMSAGGGVVLLLMLWVAVVHLRVRRAPDGPPPDEDVPADDAVRLLGAGELTFAGGSRDHAL